MKKKYVMPIFLIILLAIIAFLFTENNRLTREIKESDRKEPVLVSSKDVEQKNAMEAVRNAGQEAEEKPFSYEEYADIFETMVSGLIVDNYIFTDGTIGPDITLVEKDLTFGKRTVLNLSDKLDMGVSDSTQKLLIYEDEKSCRQMSIVFSYVPTYLESDMMSCFDLEEYNKNSKISSNKSCVTTINYKNIIIDICQTSSKNVDMQDNFTFIREIQKLLI